MRLKSRRNILIAVSVVVLAVVAVITILLLVYRQQQVGDGNSAPVAEVVSYSVDVPDETIPQEPDWKGGPTDPKRITIASAGITSLLQNVGVDQNQQIAVPNNIWFGGWFVDSARPGDAGLSIIDGHVNGTSSKNAIFSDLEKASIGDRVEVEFGDGEKRSFEITTSQQVAVEDAASILFSQDPTISNQLNLITCIGIYNEAARTFDQRLIVTAKLI